MTANHVHPPPGSPGRAKLRRWNVVIGLCLAAVLALGAGLTALRIGDVELGAADGTSPAPTTSDQAAPPSAVDGAVPSVAPTPTSVALTPSTSPKMRSTAGEGQRSREAPRKSGFPGAANTGVRPGTPLRPYTDSCTVTQRNTVIDSKIVDCTLVIRAVGVTIRNSRITGRIDSVENAPFSFTLIDSEVNAGVYQGPAVGNTNLTILRSEIQGGATSVYCWSNCVIRDSWLHGQRLGDKADWHLNGFLANDNGPDPGGRTNAVLVHNTIVCDEPPNSYGGGCSGHINLFGDFGPVTHVTVDGNLFPASNVASYCVYGGTSSFKPFGRQAEHIVVTNNVFQRGRNRKCAAYGPVTHFDNARPGNRWARNVWDDGAPVKPEM